MEFLEFLFHGGVVPCQFLDGQVIGFVGCQAQLIFRLCQRVFYFFQMLDGLVDFIDRLFEALACLVIIIRDPFFEIVHFVFKIGDIDVLSAQIGQFLLCLHGF